MTRTKVTAFKVYDSTLKLMNCYFDKIPYAVHFQNRAQLRKLVSYNNVFEHQFRAIHVQKFSCLHLLIKNCQFKGHPNASADGIIVEDDLPKQKTSCRSGKLSIYIYGCTFSFLNNAIFVNIFYVNQAIVYVNASIFMDNKVSCYQGLNKERSSGITVILDFSKPISTPAKVFVRNSKFINNTSINGGALGFRCGKGIDIVIEKCSFTDNFAIMSGGAIKGAGYCNMTIRHSKFLNNSCDSGNYGPGKYLDGLYDPYGIGGALLLFSYEKSPFDPFFEHPEASISDCVFQNNSAEYSGGAIYSNAHILNITRTSIMSRQESQLMNIDSELVRCKYRCNLRNVSFVVGHAKDGRIAALFGESNLALRLDQASKFTCPKGSTLIHRKLRDLSKRSTPDPRMKAFMMFAFFCLRCPLGHYSLGPSVFMNLTLNNQSCHKCFPGGVCQAGIIKAKNNFWGYRELDGHKVDFIQLHEGYGCNGNQCRDFNSCAKGRTGTLCATCKKGLTESMLSTKCISNIECNFVNFWILASFLFFLYLIFFIFKKELISMLKIQRMKCWGRARLTRDLPSDDYVRWDNDSIDDVNIMTRSDSRPAEENQRENTSETRNSNIATAIIKIIFYFFQVESLLKTFSYKTFSSTTINIKESLSSFFNLNFIYQSSASTCAIYDATPIKKIQIRLGLIGSLFLALFIAHAVVTLCIKNRARGERAHVVKKGKLNLANKIVVASFEIFLLNYALFTNVIFKLLSCVKVNNDMLLHIQGNIRCFQGWQYALMVLGLVWAIPFCVFIFMLPGFLTNRKIKRRGLILGCVLPLPMLFSILYKLNEERQVDGTNSRNNDDEEGQEQNGDRENDDAVLSEIFENGTGPFSVVINKRLYFSWEGVYILRRLILVVMFTFISNPVYKLYAMLLSQVAFLLHHMHMKPYAARSMNHVETASLTTLVLINSMNLFSVYDYLHGIEERGENLLLLEVFAWIQLFIGVVIPLALLTVATLIIVARLITLLIMACKALVRFARR